MATPAVLQDEVNKIRWWHTIDLGHGIRTPGVTNTIMRVEQFGFPESMNGLSVLDIGAWDGFYSFEAERRGASRVVALDHMVWTDPNCGQAGFNLARRVLNSRVEDVLCDVYDLTPERVGRFDLVLFLGVLYHVEDPLYVLERVASVTKGQLILETHVDLIDREQPMVAFYPGEECAGDCSNWCGPNGSALEAMLATVGFQTITRHATLPGPYDVEGTSRETIGRMVFHAWKEKPAPSHEFVP